MKNKFEPKHVNATHEDFEGNNGIGRYIFLPGSDGRAKEIAEYFDEVTVKEHPRMHNLYLGTLAVEGGKIDVATVASGMGCPSMEIILHELYQLGAKRFLRIGTAGSLQEWVKVGNLINVHASVRDENTTERYVPLEFPAVASLELTSCILLAAEHLGLADDLHTGTVHCKSSLYARQFGEGPRNEDNRKYVNILSQAGVLASEMETSALFIQTQFYNHESSQRKNMSVLSGAILSVISTLDQGFDTSTKVPETIKHSIELALETIKILAIQELGS